VPWIQRDRTSREAQEPSTFACIYPNARHVLPAVYMLRLDDTRTGKVEEVTLPVDKVDILISEWMGCVLSHCQLPCI